MLRYVTSRFRLESNVQEAIAKAFNAKYSTNFDKSKMCSSYLTCEKSDSEYLNKSRAKLYRNKDATSLCFCLKLNNCKYSR